MFSWFKKKITYKVTERFISGGTNQAENVIYLGNSLEIATKKFSSQNIYSNTLWIKIEYCELPHKKYNAGQFVTMGNGVRKGLCNGTRNTA